MALIEKDVKTIEELKTVIGHGGKAAVLYDVSNGEPYGLDVEVIINMDASIGNKVEKVTGKSLIADTEIARLSGVTNQTLGGLGGETAANKQDSLAVDGHGIKFPTVDAVNLGLATKPAKTTQVVAGLGLAGGGTLEADRTLNVVSANDGITVNADNIQLNVVDGLANTSATQPLSAKQGKALNDGKVDKVGGKSLISDTEIARLAGVTNQTKQTLGLENVDNTSDQDKPISTATAQALNDINDAAIEANSAIEGLLEYVDRNSIKVENELLNGDFSNGKVDWNELSSNLTTAANIGTFLPTDVNGGVRQSITGDVGDIYYFRADVKTVSTKLELTLSGGFGGTKHTGSNEWETLILRKNASYEIEEFRFVDRSTSSYVSTSIKNNVAINLTKSFGADNIPTDEQMEAFISLFPNNFFSGEIILTNDQLKPFGLNYIEQRNLSGDIDTHLNIDRVTGSINNVLTEMGTMEPLDSLLIAQTLSGDEVDKVPSVQAVNDELALKENLTNKKSVINPTSETDYPTSKGVADVILPAEQVTAESLAVLNRRIEALETIIANSQYSKIDVLDEFNLFGKTNLIILGVTSPSITPDFIGQFYINTTAGITYQSKGIGSSGDWKQTSN